MGARPRASNGVTEGHGHRLGVVTDAGAGGPEALLDAARDPDLEPGRRGRLVAAAVEAAAGDAVTLLEAAEVMLLGDDAEAAAHYLRLLASVIDSADRATATRAIGVSGFVFYALGDRSRAEQALKKAFELDRSAMWAGRLVQLFVAEDRWQDARDVIAAALEAAPDDADLRALRSSLAPTWETGASSRTRDAPWKYCS